ncbi:MAG: hypothetical protein KBD76_16100, partial [Bacteriovorax sp.]|nr:hypothetical protein [Bacteriovorax sp.]
MHKNNQNSDEKLFYKIHPGIQKFCLYTLAIGGASFALSYFHTPVRFWVNLLINNFYFISIALSGLFFLALQNITNSSWMRTYQRIPQAMYAFLPFGLVLMLLTYFGFHTLYEWTHDSIRLHDPVIMKKTLYLNTSFFLVRMVIFFILWTGFGALISYLTDRWTKAKPYPEQAALL